MSDSEWAGLTKLIRKDREVAFDEIEKQRVNTHIEFAHFELERFPS